jgi:hypothetical protein
MGYKLLGFVVWQGGKWYVRRRVSGVARKAALGGLAAIVVGGLIAVQRSQSAN